MDHAEVRDRLEGALLSSGKLYAIDTDPTEAGERLRTHLAECAACRAELGALRETAVLLAAAAPDDLAAPRDARARVLQAVRETGVVRGRAASARAERAGADRDRRGLFATTSSPGRRFRLPALRSVRLTPFRLVAAAGAAGLVLLVLALATVDLIGQRDRSAQQVRELARITAAADRLLREAGSRDVSLVGPAGKPAGTVIYSPRSGELVVVTDALPSPPPGSRYGCYLERSGQRTRIGLLRQSSGLTYWAGKMQGPADAGRSGDRFLVSLETREEEPLLVGEF